MNDMKLLIDCGGSSVKIKRYVQGVLRHTYPFKPKSLDEFYKCIEDMAKDNNPSVEPCVSGIAISLCGEYDYINEEVISCWAYPFLIGRLRDNLIERFKCSNVRIVNDGDAHALALKSLCAQDGLLAECAINLSLGTAVGFGILDWKGELLHTCRGHNWEVGNWQCDTKASCKEQYWALGSLGLKDLEKQYGNPNAYVYYGQRLCHFFARDLVPVFHPRIIGLSGGIAAAHFKEIEEGVRRECEERRYCVSGGKLDGIDVYLSSEKDSVMLGLADLVNPNGHSRPILTSATKTASNTNSGHLHKLLLNRNVSSASANNPSANPLRNRSDWEKTVPENHSCALLAINVGQTVCAEDGGGAPLVANRQTCGGSWEAFVIVNNGDGSFSLKSAANDKFVSAFPDGRMIAQGSVVDEWEKFEFKPVQGKDGVFTLWSRNTQKYVSVDENKGNVLMADRDVADAWEEFRIFCV